MATRVADRVVLDTNVLIAATDAARSDHPDALAALNQWPRAGTTLYASGQILREYLAVATRPVASNGLGLSCREAVTNVHTLRVRIHLLDENAKIANRLMELLGEVDCSGKQIHDANVVATMLAHGVDTLATFNLEDFARFQNHVRIISPGAGGRGRRRRR